MPGAFGQGRRNRGDTELHFLATRIKRKEKSGEPAHAHGAGLPLELYDEYFCRVSILCICIFNALCLICSLPASAGDTGTEIIEIPRGDSLSAGQVPGAGGIFFLLLPVCIPNPTGMGEPAAGGGGAARCCLSRGVCMDVGVGDRALVALGCRSRPPPRCPVPPAQGGSAGGSWGAGGDGEPADTSPRCWA